MEVRSWRRSLSAITVLSGMALAVGGCVSEDQYKRQAAASDQALAQLAESENDIAKLRAKVGQLEGEVAAKDKLLNDGLGGVDALRKERDLLSSRLAEMQDKYNKLLELTNATPMLPEPVSAALEELAAKNPDLMEYDKARGLVRLKSDVTFDLGSTEVKPRAKEALARVAQILNMPEVAKHELRIVGNTDDVPIRKGNTVTMNPTNWHLSANRAIAVRDVLQNTGISSARTQVAGWGEERPIAPNYPGKRGNEKNRRVDIYVLPTSVPENLVISTPGAAAPAVAPKPAAPVHKPAPKPVAPKPATEPAVPRPIPMGNG